jgi:hypothetical protein
MVDPEDIELSISTEQICFIIVKAREFSVKDVPTDLEGGSNPTDDHMVEVLENRRSDPVFAELHEFINSLDEDQQIDLVALAWIGRGDFAIEDWIDARAEAEAAHNERTADYLLGIPLLADFLENALAETGRSCEDEEEERL